VQSHTGSSSSSTTATAAVQPWQFFLNRMTVTFDLLTSGSMHAEQLSWSLHMCTKFGVDSPICFTFRVQTHTIKDVTVTLLLTSSAMPAWVISLITSQSNQMKDILTKNYANCWHTMNCPRVCKFLHRCPRASSSLKTSCQMSSFWTQHTIPT